MDAHKSLKRRRIVTTCSECHRRKQKCDRQQPCNICLARGVPSKCSYHDTAGQILESENDTDGQSQSASPNDVTGLNPYSQNPGFAEQIGYSPMSGSNVLVDLCQLLEGNTVGPHEPTSLNQESTRPNHLEDRFLAIVGELPPKTVVDELIGIIFSEVIWYYHILERHYFDQLYVSWLEVHNINDITMKRATLRRLPRDLLYFPALLFQVLAVALQFVPDEAITLQVLQAKDIATRDRISWQYSGKAIEIINTLGRHYASITTVQHDFLRALWLKNCSRGMESWHALSNATRQAQELNLHLQSKVPQSETGNVEETLNRLWYDEYKRRLWVMLFIWDSHMALVLGRPRIINASDCDIKIPIDCNIPQNPSSTIPAAHQDNDTPSSFSATLFQYSISQLIHEMRTTGANRRYPRDYSVVTNMHCRVQALLDCAPLFVRPENPDTSWDLRCTFLPRQREQIVCAANSFLLGLHRAHIHTYPDSRIAAVEAALAILDSQQRFFDKTPRNQYRFFGISFFTINSASFLTALMMLDLPTDLSLKMRIGHSLQQATTRLEILENINALSGPGLKLLRRCFMKIGYLSPLPSNSSESKGLRIESGNFSRLEESIHSGDQDQKSYGQYDTSKPTAFVSPDILRQYDQTTPSSDMWNVSADDVTFDASFWIGQMNQIPTEEPDDVRGWEDLQI